MAYISTPPRPHDLAKKPKNLVILGATGSIGRNTLAIIAQKPEQFRMLGLACATNVESLARQAEIFRPPFLATLDQEQGEKLRAILPKNYRPEIFHGSGGYAILASLAEADCILSAQSGAAGLAGTAAAALAGKTIALANKESLVIGGPILRHICAKTGAAILPVDSEHYALFTCVAGRGQTVKKLILTASGGPFLGMRAPELAKVDARSALAHPNWKMGAKISVDSATMMNKGLELIEAMELYGMDQSRVEILIHRQSIIHSMAVFTDNSMLAQLAVPDMRLPIASALFWPRLAPPFVNELDLADIGRLDFARPDLGMFPCLKLVYQTLGFEQKAATSMLSPGRIVLNAANEAAVRLFLAGLISFVRIGDLISLALEELVINKAPVLQPPQVDPEYIAASVANILAAIEPLDHAARKLVFEASGQKFHSEF